MLVTAISILTIIIPALAFAGLLLTKSRRKSIIFINYITAVSVIAFMYYYGGWIYLSYYLKFLMILAFAGMTLYYFTKTIKKPARKEGILVYILKTFWKIPVIAASVLMLINLQMSRNFPEPSVNFEFPFRNGNYVIMQGGSTELINLFHNYHPSAVFAYDITKLNSIGNRASTVFSDDLAKYEIFGERIFSPCTGVAIVVKNDFPDNVPPEKDLVNKAGNYVVINANGTYVMLAHFRKGSVQINQFDSVKTGDLLGLAGNSGNSIEPHLHIEAHRRVNGKYIPVSIKFDGNFYTYNDLIIK